MKRTIIANIIATFTEVRFFIFPDFWLKDGGSILIHYKTCLERIIANLRGDNYHPDNRCGRLNLIKFRHT